MSTVNKPVDEDVDAGTAYNQWTQFESFPQFMDGVESITQQGPTSSHWVVKVGGVTREFDTEIAERQVDKSAEEFKDLIESRGSETGAWRGDIN